MRFIYFAYILSTCQELATIEFRNQWNNHCLSAQNGQTLLQLWHTGVINNMAQQNTAVDSIFELHENFGVDHGGPLPDIQTRNNVVIPDIDVGINDTALNLMHRTFDPLQNDGNYGIDLFCSVVTFLEQYQL
ncbi:hypothetical protein GOODEAATRI_033983 [Goodea atripinnis]|uniref:Integrase core domain-containing protein n=1 Tax=Goodea atripinnis TaxID=208336 RepID=A0ABV0NQQ2_9TELE